MTGGWGGALGPPRPWRIKGGTLELDRPVVMGIVNLTPDSFSDGGLFQDVEEALDHARRLVEAGAALLDVGGESTRPGATPVPEEEELARVLPFVRRAAKELAVPISVDTRKASVARAALLEGAAVVNDVSGLAFDPGMGEVVAEAGAGVVLMHMRGVPATMAGLATYADVAAEVAAELEAALARARRSGIRDEAVVLDPGLGFAKTPDQSLELLADLAPVRALGFPLLVGPSRKSFLGAVLGVPPERRGAGTVAACLMAYLGGASIFRVHDVEPVAHALTVAHAILKARERVEAVTAQRRARS